MPASATGPRFPYVHIGHCIRGEWEVKVDGEALETPADGEPFDLTGFESGASIEVTYSVRVSADRLQSALDEGEIAGDVAALHLIVKPDGNEAARLREAIAADEGPTIEDGDFVWSGSWDIVRRKLAGNISLAPSLTRKVAGINPALARFPGEELAGAENRLRIQVTEAPAPQGDSLEVVWISFSEESLVVEDAVWSLADLDEDAAPPVLRLNKDIEDLQSLLEGPAKRGYRAKRKDALNSFIASHVWSELASLVLSQVAIDDEGSGGDELIDENDWRFRLLADLAGSSGSDFAKMSEAEAVAGLIERCRNDQGISGVAEWIDAWAQERTELGPRLGEMASAGEET